MFYSFSFTLKPRLTNIFLFLFLAWLIVAGISAIGTVVCLGFFSLFAILHVAMQLQRKEIMLSFQRAIFLKVVSAAVAGKNTRKPGLPGQKNRKGQIWPWRFSKKAKSSKMKRAIKGQIFNKKNVTITILKFSIPYNIVSSDQIFPKQAFNCSFFFNIQKRPKMAKYPNHVICGKQFPKRRNSADLAF